MGNEYWSKCGDAMWLRVKAGMAHSIFGCTCGWHVKLCDSSFTYAIPKRPRDEFTQYKALYKCPVLTKQCCPNKSSNKSSHI